MVKIAPYGSWTSPIGAADVAAMGGGPQWVGQFDGHTWWAQARPQEGGRLALCRAAPGQPAREILAAPWNARNRVHEYGGRPWTVVAGQVVFTEWSDQRLYRLDPDGDAEPEPITEQPQRPQGVRYADLVPGPDGASVWCVRETSTGEHPTDIARDLIAVPIDGGPVRVLAASHHFMTTPKPNADATAAAWLGWEHPAMPWDGTQLCVADIAADGTFGPHRVVAGGPAEAVCQVEWDGTELLALTDPTGWWNLYRVDPAGQAPAVALAPVDEELGGPMWVLGLRWFAPLGGHRYLIRRRESLAVLDAGAGTLVDVAVDVDLSDWSDIAVADGVVVGIAGSPTRDDAVVRIDAATGQVTELTPQPAGMPDVAYLPVPTERTFHDAQGRPVYAYVFLPTNPEFAGPQGSAPPLLVTVHGGPTGSFSHRFTAATAFYTSRGFAVAGVNYGGSTGHGREFRERLREQWGVVDVDDCATVARALAAEGTVDGQRMAIRGGSAGGWTSAASLTTTDVYRCGTVMFPVLDAAEWAGEGLTHDFESQYLHSLIGSWPDHADRYTAVSPATHADRLAGPVLMLQGLEDKVCPPAQADAFMANLAGSGIPHAYLRFEGEQHGFRRAETIVAALQAELSFYGQVLGFTTPGVPQLELRV